MLALTADITTGTDGRQSPLGRELGWFRNEYCAALS
jgi:hypothetical protein